jgi:hypothetical protein
MIKIIFNNGYASPVTIERFLYSPFFKDAFPHLVNPFNFIETITESLSGEENMTQKYALFIKPDRTMEIGIKPAKFEATEEQIRELVGKKDVNDMEWAETLKNTTGIKFGAVWFRWKPIPEGKTLEDV